MCRLLVLPPILLLRRVLRLALHVARIVSPASLERHDVVNDVAGAGTRGLAGRGAWWWCSKSRLAVSLRLILPWLSRVTPTAARLEEWLVRELAWIEECELRARASVRYATARRSNAWSRARTERGRQGTRSSATPRRSARRGRRHEPREAQPGLVSQSADAPRCAVSVDPT